MLGNVGAPLLYLLLNAKTILGQDTSELVSRLYKFIQSPFAANLHPLLLTLRRLLLTGPSLGPRPQYRNTSGSRQHSPPYPPHSTPQVYSGHAEILSAFALIYVPTTSWAR